MDWIKEIDWLEILIFFFEFVIASCMLFYKKHIDELAEIINARKKEYEKEQGKYEALHESIDSVLAKMEHMKNAVSLEEQRNHDFIVLRNQKLVNLIRYSEEINLAKTRLLTAINNESKKELETLQADVNTVIVNLRVDNMTLIAISPNLDNNTASLFTDAIFQIAMDLLVRISNAISLINSYNHIFNHTLELENDKDKLNWLNQAKEKKDALLEIKQNPHYAGSERYEEIEMNYLAYLRTTFGCNI